MRHGQQKTDGQRLCCGCRAAPSEWPLGPRSVSSLVRIAGHDLASPGIRARTALALNALGALRAFAPRRIEVAAQVHRAAVGAVAHVWLGRGAHALNYVPHNPR
jgi:hypothetical protein